MTVDGLNCDLIHQKLPTTLPLLFVFVPSNLSLKEEQQLSFLADLGSGMTQVSNRCVTELLQGTCILLSSNTSLLSQPLIYAPFQVKSDDVPFPGPTTPDWACIYNQPRL